MLQRGARWIGRHLQRRIRRQALILLYHRVTTLQTDPWSLAVTPEHFAEHLEVLRRYANPLSLAHLTHRLRGGNLPWKSVVVTFDDGYADNLHQAKPLLERYDIPATVFVTTGPLEYQREFWWDELDAILLQPGMLPERLVLMARGTEHHWALRETATYTDAAFLQQQGWRIWEPPPGERQRIFTAVWKLLHPLQDRERQCVLQQLRDWAQVEPANRPSHRLFTSEEVTDLAVGELVGVGAHTVTHPALAFLPEEQQRGEIEQSKQRLEQLTNRPVTTFAYPFGGLEDYTPRTSAIVRDLGFSCAGSYFPGAVHSGTDPYQLPRIYIADTDGEKFARLLSRWLPLSTA